MLFGIGPREIRLLIDDPWEGGRGHSLREVSGWTLDQVLMALADRKSLVSRQRSQKMEPKLAPRSEDGMITGRAADGTEIRGRVRGKSKCRELMEIEDQKQRKQNRKRRRGRKKG